MSADKQEKDLSLLEMFNKAVETSGGNNESGQTGNIHFHVMPDKIIKAVRERLKEIDTLVWGYEHNITIGTPQKIAACEYEIAKTEHLIPGYENTGGSIGTQLVEGSQRLIMKKKEEIAMLQRGIERDKLERERMHNLRVRYEEMVLKILEASLKG